MNLTSSYPQLRYEHMSHCRQPIDERSQRTSAIPAEHCYFVGFRALTRRSYTYFNALILADDHEALVNGISRERDAIRAMPHVLNGSEVVPVFVRSLYTQDPLLVSPEGREQINLKLKESLRKRDDEHFVVVGLRGEDKIGTLDCTTVDALSAIRVARYQCAKLHQESFTPLQVCQAHPVTNELVALFHLAAGRLQSLIDFKAGDELH